MMMSENLSVSPGIKALLPDVLIDYLSKLVICEDRKNDERQLIILEAGELSGRSVQNIYHVCNEQGPIKARRVFGVAPVNCKLQVLYAHTHYQMELLEYE